MFRFAYTEYLWFLLLIPVLTAAYLLSREIRKSRLRRFGDWDVVSRLIPGSSIFQANLKFILYITALAAMIITVARPQMGSKVEKVKRKGIDIVVALDVSNSMMARDIKPSRLERAKQALSKFTEKLENDRIGLIVFAGKAYTQMALTPDYAAAKMYIQSASPFVVPSQGTAIGAAIEMGVNSMPRESKSGKVVILLTDGENHEDDAIAAAKYAKEKNVRVFVIGVGTPGGSPIPYLTANNSIDFKRDQSGNTVISKLNESMLMEIAQISNGNYYLASGADLGLGEILKEIQKMDKTDHDVKEFSEYNEYFYFPLSLALFLLILETLVSERRYRWIASLKMFEVKKHKA
ncbi:MAG: VWA domain-containing protein [Bacteroidota bacterium]